MPVESAQPTASRMISFFFILMVTFNLTALLIPQLQRTITPHSIVQLSGIAKGLLNTPPDQRTVGYEVTKKLDATSVEMESSLADLWGTPYRVVMLIPENKVVRVYSCGPDRVSRTNGLDPDDITDAFASLENDRYDRIYRRCVTFGMIAWTTFLLWVVVIRKRKENAIY